MGFRSRPPLRWLPVLALLLALGAGGAASADQNDPALDGLFRDLRSAGTPQQAGAIEVEIWRRWFSSGSAGIDGLFQMGSALLAAGRLERAHAAFDEIVVRRPDLSEGWNRRATVRYLMGDFKGSMADIDETLEREPRHFGALSGLGLCHLALGNEEDALAAFERALIHHPHMPGARRNAERLRTVLNRRAI